MLTSIIKRIVGIIWRFGWNFRCDYCGKLRLHKKLAGNHQQCDEEYDRLIEEMDALRAVEEDAYYAQLDDEEDNSDDDQAYEDYLHMQDILDNFCSHYGCWKQLEHGLCPEHDWCPGCNELNHAGVCQLDELDELDDEPYDSYDDYDNEDPLAGDIDDGSHYVPEPSPLNTQHYFALKERGYI